MQNSKIFYLCPDHNKPSWGVGIIYHHVSILVEAGFDVHILHQNKNFKIDWLELEVPIKSLESFIPSGDDILVVPEFMAADPEIKILRCRKIVFVQNLSLIFNGFDSSISHLSLGYKEAIIIMPHMVKVVSEYTQIKPRLIPPFIADYFYKNPKKLNEREKIILLFPKQHQFEYSLIKQVIVSKAGIKNMQSQYNEKACSSIIMNYYNTWLNKVPRRFADLEIEKQKVLQCLAQQHNYGTLGIGGKNVDKAILALYGRNTNDPKFPSLPKNDRDKLRPVIRQIKTPDSEQVLTFDFRIFK